MHGENMKIGWPSWPKHVQYAKSLKTLKGFVVTDGLLHYTLCIITMERLE